LGEIYNCNKDNVIPTTGGSEANFLVFLAMLEQDDEVIVEQPGYSPLWLVPEMLGARIIPWERKFENKFALDIESLKTKTNDRTKMIVITNLHNPSGVLIDNSTLRSVSEIANDHNALLLIDEMFLDAGNTPQKTAFGMDSVIVTSSVSKIYGIGGLRTGWIIAENDIAKKCLQAKWQTCVASPYLSEVIVGVALKKAKSALLKRYKEIENRNRPVVEEWIEANSSLLDWNPPDGSVLCFPQYKPKISSVEFAKALLTTKEVLISPGEYFGLNGHFRLTFMNTMDELRFGLDAIIECLGKY
jgi:aspartate/methionine/tyrosine aminotransferase